MSSNYHSIRKIGQGQHGSVYLVQKKIQSNQKYSIKSHQEQQLYAMKKIPISNNYFSFQANSLLTLDHPNVIHVSEVFHEQEHIVLILQLAEEGDLHQFIKRNYYKKVPQSQIISWFCQLSLGLYYLHQENNIIHRDIKLRNVLVKQNGLLKLADFGVAKKLQKGQDFAKTSVGTPCYLSPETINFGKYDNKSDVWSLGCLLYQICTGQKPFTGESLGTLLQNIVNTPCGQISNKYSQWLKDIICRMLQKNPQKRPSILDLLQIPQIRKQFKLLKGKYKEYDNIVYPQQGPKTTKYLQIDEKKINLKVFSQSLKTTKNQRTIRHQIQATVLINRQKLRQQKPKSSINDLKLIHRKILHQQRQVKNVQRKPAISLFELKSSEYLAPQKVDRKIQLAKAMNESCSLNRGRSNNMSVITNPGRKVERDKFVDKSLKALISKKVTDRMSRNKDINKQ